MGRLVLGLFTVLLSGMCACAQNPERVIIAQTGIPTPPIALQTTTSIHPPATADPGDRTEPITLATALRLAGSRPYDVQIAEQHVTIATKQLDRAKLLWVPNLVTGLDYFRHEGGQQNFAGEIVRSSRGALSIGVGPNAVVSVADAIYAPLAAKQDLRARHAIRDAVQNDSTLAVVEAYFTVQQARGELAGALVALAKADEVAKKAEKLAEGLALPLEASRTKVELARREQAVSSARERWRIASADLVRWLRLEPGTLVEPMELPFLPISIIDPSSTLDLLIPIALTSRPELAGHQAVVQATLTRLNQEKMRPLIPSLALRSTSTNPSGSIGYGGFGGGPNDKMRAFGSRFDLDFQVLWEFQSLGFGNKARSDERRAEHQAATLELFRLQDRIAAEVSVAFAQAKAASERMNLAEPALKVAIDLLDKSLRGMGQTKRIGDTNLLIIRPQEVVSAVQAFAQANTDLYASVADYNRAQFRLYRALGHPADQLTSAMETKAPSAATPLLDGAVGGVGARPLPTTPPQSTIRQTAYTQRGGTLPAPKPMKFDEPRLLTKVKAEPLLQIHPPTRLTDLPVMLFMLNRPTRPTPDAPSLIATTTNSEPATSPTSTNVTWATATSPQSEPPQPQPILPEPKSESPVNWNSPKK
jgi:outer membrane protein TolC